MSDRKERVAKVIAVLNEARSMELQAIHQYMNQHYNLDDRDYGEFAAKLKLIAIDEMRHAEQFAERVKELGGEPTSELATPIVKGQDVRVIFNFDSESEINTMDKYNQFLNLCRELSDSQSARILETIIDEEQLHETYFSNIHGHIKELGDTYLSKIAGTPSATGLGQSGFVSAASAASA